MKQFSSTQPCHNRHFWLLPLFLLSTYLSAQTPLWYYKNWSKNGASFQPTFQQHTASARDASNNSFLASSALNTTTDFYEMSLQKRNSSGTLLWDVQFTLNTAGNVHVASLAIDGSGNVIVVGSAYNGATNGYDLYVVKYNTSGTKLWHQTYNSAISTYDGASDVAIGTSDQIYVSGATFSSAINVDALTRAYDSSGSLLWSNVFDHVGLTDGGLNINLSGGLAITTGFSQSSVTGWDFMAVQYNETTGALVNSNVTSTGGTSFEQIGDATTDASGNIYITGALAASGQGLNIRTIKMNTGLAIMWQATYNGTANQADAGVKIAVDASENVYVTGYTTGATRDLILVKYNNTGTQQWAKIEDGNPAGSDEGRDVKLDAGGKIYVAGFVTNHDTRDKYIGIFDASGNKLWSETENGIYNGHDEATAIQILPGGSFLVVGTSAPSPTSSSAVAVTTTSLYSLHTLAQPVDNHSSSPFVKNNGQLLNTDDDPANDVAFYSQQTYPNLYLGDGRISYVFAHIDTVPASNDTMARVDMIFDNTPNGRKCPPVGLEKKSFFHNYYLGHIPEGREIVPNFDKVIYPEVWAGIDVVCGQNAAGSFSQFIIKPGADITDIAWHFDGASNVSVDGNGDLLVETALESLVMPKPTGVLLTPSGEGDFGTDISFEVDENGGITMAMEGEPDDTLVIEVGPDLEPPEAAGNWWSTYFGFTDRDLLTSVDMDELNNIYTTGRSMSSNFPVVNFLQSPEGQSDITANKFDQSGVPKWFVMIGSKGNFPGFGGSVDFHEKGFDISVAKSPSTSLYIAGKAASPWPVSMMPNPKGGFQENSPPSNLSSVGRGCLVRLTQEDGIMEWATFFGDPNNREEMLIGVKAKAEGGVVVTGLSSPTVGMPSAFPVTNGPGLKQTFGSMIIGEFDDTDHLEWATKFGPVGEATNDANKPNDITEDSNGNLFVVGEIIDDDDSFADLFPIGDAPTMANFHNANSDGFVIKFNQSRNPVWGTCLGASGGDNCSGVAVDDAGRVLVVGVTNSTNFPVKTVGNASVDDTTLGGGSDLFVGRFSNDGVQEWTRYFGGDGFETMAFTNFGDSGDLPGGNGIAVDDQGNFAIVGSSSGQLTTNWPAQTPPAWFFPNHNGATGHDAFIAQFLSNLSVQACSYYGSNENTDHGHAIAVSRAGDNEILVFVGKTFEGASDYPTNDPVQDNSNYFSSLFFGGASDGFITSISVPLQEVVPTLTLHEDVLLAFFPNPCHDLLRIEFTKTLVGSRINCSIIDIAGRNLTSENLLLIDGSFQLNTKDFASGVYFLKINTGNKVYCGKFVKSSN